MLLHLVKLSSSVSSMWGSSWKKEVPKAALHHHPQVTHHTSSPSTSQPRSVAIGILNIYPKLNRFIDTSISTFYTGQALGLLFRALREQHRLPALLHTHPQGSSRPPAAVCPQQTHLFANHTQDTQGMQTMFANSN